MTVWAALFLLGLGVAIGAAGVYLQLTGDAERAAIRQRAERNTGARRRPCRPPRSHCHTVRPPYDQEKAR